MLQDELVTPQQLLSELVPAVTTYSVTRVVGGKLRALYEDDAQPSPSQMTELLNALERNQVAN